MKKFNKSYKNQSVSMREVESEHVQKQKKYEKSEEKQVCKKYTRKLRNCANNCLRGRYDRVELEAVKNCVTSFLDELFHDVV